MANVLHITANANNQAIYNSSEAIGDKINFDPCVAYGISLDILTLFGHNLIAAKVRSICTGLGIAYCDKYDPDLLDFAMIESLGTLEITSWVYGLFCECNMNTAANQLSDWINNL